MEKKLTKEEFIAEVAAMGEYTQADARRAVNNVVGALRKIFAEDNQDALSFSGFGSFRVNHNPARKGRNPRTGAEITIPAGKTLKFKASKKLFQ